MISIPFRAVGLALAAALLASGCSDSSGPDGDPTDLTVRVYVDADGSGQFSPGDVGVAGATVTATGDDGATQTAQTDAQGNAALAALRPGSYTLSVAGNVPAGAVLSTARTPLFTATAQGGTATAEFRYAFFPGSVSGRLFRDDNNNNTYDASDYAAPSIPVELYAGTAVSGTPAATTTTDATGAFSFSGVRPGTYMLRFVVPPTVNVVGGPAQQITVVASTPLAAPVRFTGTLRIPIAQARTRPANSVVTVEGVVTAGRGQLGARNFYVQDNTGGIQVFLPSASTIAAALGDSVRITGGVSAFGGEPQISAGTITLEKLGTGTVPAPRNVNGPDVMARTFEGQLARVDSLEVISVVLTGGSATTPPTGANVNVRTPQGDLFQVRLDNLANVPASTFEPGRVYTVTGPLGFANNSTPQIKPRGTADVTRTSAPTIADAKAQPVGSTATVVGIVTTTLGEFTNSSAGLGNVYVQDRTGGIQVFGVPVSQGLVPGDSVAVTGTIGVFSGETQITTPNLTVTKLGTGTVPAPRVITGAQLASRAFEGELVRVNGLTVTSVGSQSTTTSSYNVVVTAPDGTSFTVRVEGRTNLERTAFTVGSTYDIVGIASGFVSGTTPAVEQLKPRGTADVTAR
jgi:DNA/RNA endonuclease YhcR with UshA esterase domain